MEWNKNLNIYQRLIAVMNEIDYIQKGDKKVNDQYKYVSHDAVTAKCRSILIKHGIVVETKIDQASLTEPKLLAEATATSPRWAAQEFICFIKGRIVFINADNPDDRMEVDSLGSGLDKQDKATGKAISYLFKYGLLKGLMLETGDDPDHDQTTNYASIEKPKAKELTLDELCATVDAIQTKAALLALDKMHKGLIDSLKKSNPEGFKTFHTKFEAKLASFLSKGKQ